MLRAFVLAALAWAVAGGAHAATWRLEYEGVAYGIFRFGRAEIGVTVDGNRYDSAATIAAAGIASIFGQTRLAARSRGAFGDFGLAPQLYELDHRYRGVHRLSSVDWGGENVRVLADPAFPFEPNPAPTEDMRRRGRDPLATILTMGAQAAREQRCAGTFRVFDGLYVYDLALRDRGRTVFRFDDEEWAVIRCGVQQRRVAGYRRPRDLDRTAPEGEIWFTTSEQDTIGMPVRFVSRLPLGEAVIRLTSVSRVEGGS